MTPEESELLAVVGRKLWLRCKVGDRTFERMTHLRPGDLVLEISRWGQFDPDGIGRLVRTEPPGGKTGDLTVRWVVEPLHQPGTEFGWRNADFIALPDRRKWLDAP